MKTYGPPSAHLRSPQFSAVTKPLTDARITHYIRIGYYGAERQRDQLIADALKRFSLPKTPRSGLSSSEVHSIAMKLLGL